MADNSLYKFKPNLTKRIFATIIDYGICCGSIYAYIMLFGQDNDSGGKTLAGLPVLAIPLFWFLYFVCVEAFNNATLGHMAFNLQVFQANRKPIDFSDAFKRHLLDPIDFFLGIPAIIAIKKTDKHQRLGDLWAGTIVVDKTDPDQYYQFV